MVVPCDGPRAFFLGSLGIVLASLQGGTVCALTVRGGRKTPETTKPQFLQFVPEPARCHFCAKPRGLVPSHRHC
jgi:hypothetical protein